MFDALFGLSLFAALVTLYRLRPALFVLALNQAVVLRALANMAEFGQPSQQRYLPAALYSPGNLEIAGNLFLLSTAVLLVFALWPARPRPPAALPGLPRWALSALAAYLALVALSTRTILTHEYTDPARMVFNLNLSGVHALLVGLFVYECYRRVASRRVRPLWALGLIFAVLLATDFLKGGTGFATGVLIGASFLFLAFEPLRRWRVVFVIASLAGALLLATVVRGVRVSLHRQGAEAVSSFAEDLVRAEQDRAANAEGVEGLGNGTQYAAHVLECISLYEAGISREWRSIYLPLEYTFKPSVLVEALGLTRSEEAAWELGRYYIHGGGIYLLGELYWNGGYLCAALVFTLLGLWAFLCDTRAGSSFFWSMCACQLCVGFLQGIGYGFAQASRCLLNGLLVVLAFWAVRLVTRKRTGQLQSAVI